MRITVFIPYLIPPREIAAAGWNGASTPRLKSALAKAACSHDTRDSLSLLCGLFGVERQQDWPLAPLLASGDNLNAGQSYWLCATPMHLETRRHGLTASHENGLQLSEAESVTLAATLGAHLQDEKITLHTPWPTRWYLQCANPPAMTTTPWDTVAGRDVRTHLPTGKDSARWHRLLTEMQMLLHSHPVNAEREAIGLPAVNSLWLWGGGVMPPVTNAPDAPFATVFSGDTTLRALARHTGCLIANPPRQFTPYTSKPAKNARLFFSLESLIPSIRHGDLAAWQAAMAALEQSWIAPLLDALNSQHLSELTLISSTPNGSRQFVIRKADRWKWWRTNAMVD